MIRRGDVCWYRFAQPDKRRPVVVLTRDAAIDFLGEVTVAPITTTIRDIPSEVHLDRHTQACGGVGRQRQKNDARQQKSSDR